MEASGAILWTAASLAVVHTLLGVDHALPFVVLAKVRGWSLRRTLLVTLVCGLGHVASSVLLGFGGIALGVAAERLSWIESTRGSLAAWFLIAFGLVYAGWGLRQARRPRPPPAAASPTFWVLFTIFVLGPCEPLIPLMMAPAMQQAWGTVAGVVAIFGSLTVASMLGAVLLGRAGLALARVPALERHAHALAGLTIAAGGVAVQALGL